MKTVALLLSTLLLLHTGQTKRRKTSKIDERIKSKCDQCRKITSTFEKEFNRTKTSIHFHGRSEGWSEDNEKFLGRYEMDEARLVEILDSLCGKNHQCATLLEDLEEFIEDWWRIDDQRESAAGLFDWLCIEKANLCCNDGHFGKDCLSCPGNSAVCNGHGQCEGDGLRTGSGRCKCADGFSGKQCNKCKKGFYATTLEAGQVESCLACDSACGLDCSGPGPDSCVGDCRKGYRKQGQSCVDIDECDPDDSDFKSCNAGSNHFCQNLPGSYKCGTCDESCARCTGPSSSDCEECQSGFYDPGNGICEDIDECLQFPCKNAEVCLNSKGSYTCTCLKPASVVQDTCVYSDNHQACIDTAEKASARPSDISENILLGTFEVGNSPSPSLYFVGNISHFELMEVPHFSFMQAKDPCCGDEFEVYFKSNHSSSVEIVVNRLDKQQGWDQSLVIEYGVVRTQNKHHTDEL